MEYNKNAIIEAIGGLKMLLHDFEKKATPRVPFKAMRHALATAIECCEKQIPKKPIFSRLYATTPDMNCPVCGNMLITYPKHCEECGQKIDWGD